MWRLGVGLVLTEAVEVVVPCSAPFCRFRCNDFHNETSRQVSGSEFWPELAPVKVENGEGALVYPIGFSIPEEALVPCLPEKYWPFAVSDGSDGMTPVWEYQFQFYQEAEYHRQYRHAYFGITRKKYGYDCLRHYEIIANGALPLFLGHLDLPEKAVPFLPRDLLKEAWELLGNWSLHKLRAKRVNIDQEKYYTLLRRMMTYARHHLTTKAMAKYVLQTVRRYDTATESEFRCPKILFLVGRPAPDYQRDLILHGLKKLCDEVVDFPRVDHLYSPNPKIRPDPVHDNWQKRRGQLYGNGFTYAMTLDFDLGQVDRDGILAKILDHAYDLVIFGSIYRNPTFFREVQEAYAPKDIVFIDGEDLHLRDPAKLARAGWLFRRELVME
ncbi:Pentatricopeptide repeat-containing protein [Durusdinium trenchii]|uniref:Chloroplastic n=1 Tax=Durusdinium trenchii TaxID=1381693 RepID=A0ABP0KDX1_9DINO